MRTTGQWIGAFIISLFPSSELNGVRVITTDRCVNRDACLAKLQTAWEVAVSAGREYELLLGRIQSIVIWPGDRTFAEGSSRVHISSGDLLGISDLALASVLVHEAVHLRINALGIPYKSVYRARIERLCIRIQARFLRGWPGIGEDMAGEAEAALASPWWTTEARAADLERLLKAHGIPTWLKTLLPRA